MTKTIMILAIAAAFVAGMFISSSDAVAQGIATSPDKLLKQLLGYDKKLDKISTKLTDTGEGIGTSPLTFDQTVAILDALNEIEDVADEIQQTVIDVREDIIID